MAFSPDFSKFATFEFADRKIRIFSFYTGKLMKTYDESLEIATQMHQQGTLSKKLDDMEFGKRLATEREIEKTAGGQSSTCNLGNFVN